MVATLRRIHSFHGRIELHFEDWIVVVTYDCKVIISQHRYLAGSSNRSIKTQVIKGKIVYHPAIADFYQAWSFPSFRNWWKLMLYYKICLQFLLDFEYGGLKRGYEFCFSYKTFRVVYLHVQVLPAIRCCSMAEPNVLFSFASRKAIITIKLHRYNCQNNIIVHEENFMLSSAHLKFFLKSKIL